MRCPFYGYHAVELMDQLYPSGGNQCALKTGGYFPCEMEIAGNRPELENCGLNGTPDAIAFAGFEKVGEQPALDASDVRYPD